MATAIPAKTAFDGASVRQSDYKIAFEQFHDFLTGLLGSDGVAATARAALGAQRAFDVGTRMLFQQSATPTGWTKEVGAAFHDNALRIVTGSVTGGGADNFSTVFGGARNTSPYTLLLADTPAHTHPLTDPGHSHSGSAHPVFSVGSSGNIVGAIDGSTNPNTTGISMSSVGGGGAHSHGMPNMNLKYTDLIIGISG